MTQSLSNESKRRSMCQKFRTSQVQVWEQTPWGVKPQPHNSPLNSALLYQEVEMDYPSETQKNDLILAVKIL